MAHGWVKLSRNIDSWRWRNHPATLSVWVWLLTHADETGRAVWQERRIVNACGISRRQAQTALKHLTAAPAEVIAMAGANGQKIAQVIAWKEYQFAPKSMGTQNAHKRDEKGTQNAHKRDTEKLLEWYNAQRIVDAK